MSRTQTVVSQFAKLQLQVIAIDLLFDKETFCDFEYMVYVL
jgi:hypothetical protein